jgi:hypothetical protein
VRNKKIYLKQKKNEIESINFGGLIKEPGMKKFADSVWKLLKKRGLNMVGNRKN